jgi:hypothetical protein
MEISGQNYKYIEWKSAEEMHFSSIQWISELNFIKDEHQFFEDMLKEYTLPIIESHLLTRVKDLIDRLTKYKQKADTLLNKITEHRNGLQIMVDGINQLEEENRYKKEHRKLLIDVNQFSLEYNALKKEIFETISWALKQQKQKRLLS